MPVTAKPVPPPEIFIFPIKVLPISPIKLIKPCEVTLKESAPSTLPLKVTFAVILFPELIVVAFPKTTLELKLIDPPLVVTALPLSKIVPRGFEVSVAIKVTVPEVVVIVPPLLTLTILSAREFATKRTFPVPAVEIDPVAETVACARLMEELALLLVAKLPEPLRIKAPFTVKVSEPPRIVLESTKTSKFAAVCNAVPSKLAIVKRSSPTLPVSLNPAI